MQLLQHLSPQHQGQATDAAAAAAAPLAVSVLQEQQGKES